MAKRQPQSKGPEERAPERRPDGTFAPGSSGNPGGVPEWVRKVRAQLEEGSPEAADLLKRLVRGEVTEEVVTKAGVMTLPADAKTRAFAAKTMLEFVVPKPKQEIEVTGKNGRAVLLDLKSVSDADIEALERLSATAGAEPPEPEGDSGGEGA